MAVTVFTGLLLPFLYVGFNLLFHFFPWLLFHLSSVIDQESLAVLSPHSEFVATFLNEDNEPEPRLAYCCMQEREADSPGQKSAPLAPLWCVRETATIAPEQGRLDDCLQAVHLTLPADNINTAVAATDGLAVAPVEDESVSIRVDGDEAVSPRCYLYTRCHVNPYFDTSRSKMLSQYTVTTHTVPVSAADEVAVTTSSSSATSSSSHDAPDPSVDLLLMPSPTTSLAPPAHTAPPASVHLLAPHLPKSYQYTLVNCARQNEEMLDSWKGLFGAVWEMKCALPLPGDPPSEPSESSSEPTLLSVVSSADIRSPSSKSYSEEHTDGIGDVRERAIIHCDDCDLVGAGAGNSGSSSQLTPISLKRSAISPPTSQQETSRVRVTS